MKPSQENVRKILVVTLSNLGDVVLTLPVFQSLVEAYPKAEIHAVVGQGGLELLQMDPRLKKVTLYNRRLSLKEKVDLVKSIRSERYDLLIDLRRSFLGFFGGARFRNSYLLFSKRTIHRAEKHLAALKGIVPKSSEANIFLRTDPASTKTEGKRLVVAAPGSKSDIKKWPAAHFAVLLDRLAGEEDCQIVLVGDKSDGNDILKIKALMKKDATDLSGRTNLKELITLFKGASLVITNDSAPLHLADAVRTPVLAFFGPTDPRRYGPRLGSGVVMRLNLFCAPCEKAQCRYHHECMQELPVGDAYKKALALLNDQRQPKNLKILAIRLDRIGDVVLSLPAIEAIKRRFPNAFLSVMTRPSTAKLVEGHPLVDETIPYYYESKGRHRSFLGNIRFLREIIERRFDVVFILHPSVRSHLVPFLAGIPYRIGFDSYLPFLLTKKVKDVRTQGLKHESDYTLDIVRAFDVEASSEKKLNIPVFYEEDQVVDAHLRGASIEKNERIIALHAGSSCASKRWPKERFAELGKKINERLGARIILIGGNEEKPLGEYLKNEIGGQSIDLTGRLSLKELAALLSKCQVLVTTDSGPMHIAAARNTRTLCIFGRKQPGLGPRRWKALGEGHRFVHKDVGCVVCLADACTIDFECLKAASVEEVFGELQEMMACEVK